MKTKYILTTVVLFTSALFSYAPLKAQLVIDVEGGAVFTGYNNVRIPGNTGTLFSLKDDLKPNPAAFIRLRVGYTLGTRHTISLLYAPLTVRSEGTFNNPVNFEGETFPAGGPVDAQYTFNSYRLTYRYDIVKRPKTEFGLGFTAKIRDAEIALESEEVSSNKTKVGFVPIIHIRFHYQLNDKLGLLLEGDALAAPQGRAEDILLAATYKFSEKVGIKAGYRILEGGADNDEVYNFSLFNYAAIGAFITF
jgi:hypothetical protein